MEIWISIEICSKYWIKISRLRDNLSLALLSTIRSETQKNREIDFFNLFSTCLCALA